jgi:hypothetical protein
MSGYPIDNDDDDEMDDYHKSDYDSTSSSTSNFRFNKYSADNQKTNFEDDDSENVGKSITITMPTENIGKLQYESKFKDVSFNTKINQIIKNHLDWYSNALLARMSYIPKSIIAKAIDQLTEQQLSEFAQSAVNDLEEMSLLLLGEFSFSSFLDILNTWLRITQTPSRFDETGHEYKIIIRHDVGYKYSFLLKEVFRFVMKERFHKSFHHNMTENLILIRSAR